MTVTWRRRRLVCPPGIVVATMAVLVPSPCAAQTLDLRPPALSSSPAVSSDANHGHDRADIRPSSLDSVVRAALAAYPSILTAESNREAAHYGVEQARAGHYPSIGLNSQRRIAGLAYNTLGPQFNVNLYASGAIQAGVEREQWREQSLASTVTSTREDVAFAATQAWFRLLRAALLQQVNQRSLERHAKLVDDFAAIANIDQGRRYDLVQARSRAEQVRQFVSAGQAEMAAAQAALLRYYPRPVDPASLNLPPPLPDPGPPNKDAVTTNPSVEAARRSVMSAEANVRATRDARGPRIDLSANGGAYSSTVVQFSWPAFDLAKSAAQDAAEASLVGTRSALQEQELIVREQQQTAWQAWQAAARSEQVARGQIKASSELIDVYRVQFQIGRRNLLDLLNAFAELYSAETAYENARVDLALSRYQLEYAAGHLARLFESPVADPANPPR